MSLAEKNWNGISFPPEESTPAEFCFKSGVFSRLPLFPDSPSQTIPLIVSAQIPAVRSG
jgi:hypothetical protein